MRVERTGVALWFFMALENNPSAKVSEKAMVYCAA